jgi:hypothetical protein
MTRGWSKRCGADFVGEFRRGLLLAAYVVFENLLSSFFLLLSPTFWGLIAVILFSVRTLA